MEEQRACPKCRALYGSEVLFCPRDGAPLAKPGLVQSGSGNAAPGGDSDDPYLELEVAGQFRIERLIGIGAMGRVYRAHQSGIERPVAIKILHRDLMRNPSMAARLQREAKVASRLNHPNVVQILMTGQLEKSALDVGGETYLAMEYLDGLSLRSALAAADGGLPLARALHIVLQACDAVGEAHEAGIVHRDLKPENVMLVRRAEDSDYVKVLDFGVARMGCADATVATQAGVIFGTARYVSPEGAQGEPVSPRSDVYSLATLLYECLAGVTPFDGDSPVAILIKQTTATPPELRSIPRAAYVPEPIARVVHDNLRKNPQDRAANARDLGRALVEAVRRSGLRPDELVIRSSLLAGQPAHAPSGLECTRSLALSSELEARLKGELSAASASRASMNNGPSPESVDAAAEAVIPEVPKEAAPSSVGVGLSSGAKAPPAVYRGHRDGSSPGQRGSAVELTLSDASADPPLGTPLGLAGAPSVPSASGGSSLASVAGQVIFPDSAWEPPPSAVTRGRRWPIGVVSFCIGGAIALAVALRLGVFSERGNRLDSYLVRANAAMENGAWDAPPGNNFKDIVAAGLSRYPAHPNLLVLRRTAARQLTDRAQALRARQLAEALRWAHLALEFTPDDPVTVALVIDLDAQWAVQRAMAQGSTDALSDTPAAPSPGSSRVREGSFTVTPRGRLPGEGPVAPPADPAGPAEPEDSPQNEGQTAPDGQPAPSVGRWM